MYLNYYLWGPSQESEREADSVTVAGQKLLEQVELKLQTQKDYHPDRVNWSKHCVATV